MVRQYNTFMEQAVEKEIKKFGQGAVNKGTVLRWLPFFERLFKVSEASARDAAPGDEGPLLEGLSMDGTHISPSYVSLLEACFQ